jgi:beta-glucosidase
MRLAGQARAANPGSPWVGAADIAFTHRNAPTTAMGWEIVPANLTDVLVRLVTDYDCPPICITENGAAFDDDLATRRVDGTCDDTERTAYLADHLAACRNALIEGVDLRGYFAWSLLDNFEWAWGFERRFGIISVDCPTGRRTPKASAHYLRDVVRANALPG